MVERVGDGTTMCWYYVTFIGSHVMSMKQPWSWGGIQQERERALLCAMYFNARCHNIPLVSLIKNAKILKVIYHYSYVTYVKII